MHHPLEQLRVAPEDVEALVEQLALVAPVHEHRVQRPVEILAAPEAHRLDRPQRLQHPPRPDRQPGRAQGAGEVHHVAGEAARPAAVVSMRAKSPGGGAVSGPHMRDACPPDKPAPQPGRTGIGRGSSSCGSREQGVRDGAAGVAPCRQPPAQAKRTLA